MNAKFEISSMADIQAIEETPLSEFMRLQTTYELIGQSARLHGDKPALSFILNGKASDPAFTLSYSELLCQITQTANFLHRLNVGPKDVVSILLPNMIETHLALWGAEAAGIANPISPLLEPSQIAGIMNSLHSKVLITPGPCPGTDLWNKVKIVSNQVRSLRAIIAVDFIKYLPFAPKILARLAYSTPKMVGNIPCHSFDDLRRTQPTEKLISGRVIQPQDIASFFHTGGTTGIPKIAAHTHYNEAFMGTMLGSCVHLPAGSVVLCGLPLFHVNAVNVSGLGPLMTGGHIVLLSPSGFRGKEVIPNFWSIVEKYQAILFNAVPTVFAGLLAHPVGDYNLSSLKYAITGAAPMPKDIFLRFQKLTGLKILEGYGQTEGTCVSSFNPPHGESRIGSIGLRIPYQEMKVVHRLKDSTSFQDCEPEEIGNIIIRGPNVFPGYTESSLNEESMLEDGWLDTGDLGRVDSEGYFWITGRARDLILRGGHNLDPAMIEEALCSHPDIDLAAAVGQPDLYAGELPVAFVQPRPGTTIDSKALSQFAMEVIPEKAAVPIRIEILQQLPLTPVGKIFKPALRYQTIIFAYTEALQKEGIESKIEITEDRSRGTLAKITLSSRDHLKKAGEILGNFTIPCEFDLP